MRAIDILIELQQKEHLTDEQFAREIGTNRIQWNKIKNGKRNIGVKIVRQLRNRYPFLPDSFFLSLLLGEDYQLPASSRGKDTLNLNFKRTLYVMSKQIGRFSPSAFRILRTRSPFNKAGSFHQLPPFIRRG